MAVYDEFDSNKPDGSTGTGTTFAGDLLKNIRSGARDHALVGRVKGFVMKRAQGSGPDLARSQFIYFMNDTLSIGFRLDVTWGGTGTVQPTSVAWSWASGADYNTNPASATWTAIGSAQANTFDANDNITATTNSGGWFTWFLEALAKLFRLKASFDTHASATGTAVHGLGSMSTQSSSSVAVSGGTLNGVDIGTTTRGKGNFTRVSEDRLLANPGLNAGVTLDANVYGGAHITHNGANTVTITNAQLAQGLAVYVTNLDAITFSAVNGVDWGLGGKPACNGAAEVMLTYYGASWIAKVSWRAV